MENVEMELIDKEKVLKENIKDIAQLDEAILLIEDQQSALAAEKEMIEGVMQSSQIDKTEKKIDSMECEKKLCHKDGICGSESANGKFKMRVQL